VLKPWLREEWCLPSLSGEFVWRMEDVLDLYAAPPDPQRPLVCFDECPYQLVGEVEPPRPVAPGQPARIDYEYERKGTCNLFLLTHPEAGWRQVTVTDRRTKQDFAHQMQSLVDERFPDAEMIRVILDNLNTHSPGSLYEAFPAAEAYRLSHKLAFHSTPKHGSWLNMAEIELAALMTQCLDRRIAASTTVREEVTAWATQRNKEQTMIHWQFTTPTARTKLQRLYPS
jgi:hypothetical protein